MSDRWTSQGGLVVQRDSHAPAWTGIAPRGARDGADVEAALAELRTVPAVTPERLAESAYR